MQTSRPLGSAVSPHVFISTDNFPFRQQIKLYDLPCEGLRIFMYCDVKASDTLTGVRETRTRVRNEKVNKSIY